MSIESHLAELERRHQAIENEIEQAQNNPAANEVEISELKRRKLRLKDQIAKLAPAKTVH